MKLLSQERLDLLYEQRDYLYKLKAFMVANYAKEVGLPVDSDHVTVVTLKEWQKAGLVESATRITHEIKFLEDFLA